MAQRISQPMSLPPSVPDRPGRVAELRGIILQSDAVSVLGAWIILHSEFETTDFTDFAD